MRTTAAARRVVRLLEVADVLDSGYGIRRPHRCTETTWLSQVLLKSTVLGGTYFVASYAA